MNDAFVFFVVTVFGLLMAARFISYRPRLDLAGQGVTRGMSTLTGPRVSTKGIVCLVDFARDGKYL
jgi:hypothetical protein